MAHGKVKAQIEFLKKYGIFQRFLAHVKDEQRIAFEYIDSYMENV